MAGLSRPKDGAAPARLCPAIHPFFEDSSSKAMDPRVKPGVTVQQVATPPQNRFSSSKTRQGISASGRHGDGDKNVFAQAAGRKPTEFRAGRRHQLCRGTRRERRAGRRIRLRQIHHVDEVRRLLDRPRAASCSTATRSAPFCPMRLRGCRCARASRWCFRIRPTASIRALPPQRAIVDPINAARRRQRPRLSCGPAVRSSPAWSGLPVNTARRFPASIVGWTESPRRPLWGIALHPKLGDPRRATAALGTSRAGGGANLLHDLSSRWV